MFKGAASAPYIPSGPLPSRSKPPQQICSISDLIASRLRPWVSLAKIQVKTEAIKARRAGNQKVPAAGGRAEGRDQP